MTTYKYIVLENSNASLVKKFKAIGMKPMYSRMDSMDYTLDGRPDKSSGPIINTYSYVLRVPADAQLDATYGTMAELKTLYDLTNPSATPSDVITLTDHYGNEHDCYFMGDMSPEPLTTMLEGDSAWHIVQIALQEIPA